MQSHLLKLIDASGESHVYPNRPDRMPLSFFEKSTDERGRSPGVIPRLSTTIRVVMSAERWATLAGSRSRIYGMLAAAYNRLPDESLVERLASLDTGGHDWPPELADGLDLIEGFSRSRSGKPLDERATELSVERTRLLRGLKPGYGPPPPYEAVYAGSDGQPRMQATAAVAKAYAEAGVGLPEGLKEQPDYIGLELDFMRHLTEREARAWAEGNRDEAVRIVEKERRFLEEHLARWVPRFCEVMDRAARLDYYRGIARMTGRFVQAEARSVRSPRENEP
jgi:putative dimethyl sulfoxide reductase chaperone